MCIYQKGLKLIIVDYFCSMFEKAEFVVSSPSLEKCPELTGAEIAFIGRSNVGKSSLINMLTGNKKLAKTSGVPGKTQLINHFKIDEQWYLVDLPGYGFAKSSKKNRKAWAQMIEDYLGLRDNLLIVFVLIDSRLPPQKIDLEFIEWCGENAIPFALVFTKADKQSVNKGQQNIAKFKKVMLQSWEALPPIFLSSAESGYGKEELTHYIYEILEN